MLNKTCAGYQPRQTLNMAQTDISMIIFIFVVSELTTLAEAVLATLPYSSFSHLKQLLVRGSVTEFRQRETSYYVTH